MFQNFHDYLTFRSERFHLLPNGGKNQLKDDKRIGSGIRGMRGMRGMRRMLSVDLNGFERMAHHGDQHVDENKPWHVWRNNLLQRETQYKYSRSASLLTLSEPKPCC